MNEFVNLQAVEDNIDDIAVAEENMVENVSDVDFFDDKNNFLENKEDYYAFTDVKRSVEYSTNWGLY